MLYDERMAVQHTCKSYGRRVLMNALNELELSDLLDMVEASERQGDIVKWIRDEYPWYFYDDDQRFEVLSDMRYEGMAEDRVMGVTA